MPLWVPTVVCSTLIFFGTIAAQIFFKWVPEAENQKRHLKSIGWSIFDVLSVGVQSLCLYVLAKHSGPPTNVFVITAAFTVCSIFIALFGVFVRRVVFDQIVTRSMAVTAAMIKITVAHIEETNRLRLALEAIVEDPSISPDTVSRIVEAMRQEAS